ncbi:hypothetical protein OC835_006683, partial [Tilletia horrida]
MNSQSVREAILTIVDLGAPLDSADLRNYNRAVRKVLCAITFLTRTRLPEVPANNAHELRDAFTTILGVSAPKVHDDARIQAYHSAVQLLLDTGLVASLHELGKNIHTAAALLNVTHINMFGDDHDGDEAFGINDTGSVPATVTASDIGNAALARADSIPANASRPSPREAGRMITSDKLDASVKRMVRPEITKAGVISEATAVTTSPTFKAPVPQVIPEKLACAIAALFTHAHFGTRPKTTTAPVAATVQHSRSNDEDSLPAMIPGGTVTLPVNASAQQPLCGNAASLPTVTIGDTVTLPAGASAQQPPCSNAASLPTVAIGDTVTLPVGASAQQPPCGNAASLPTVTIGDTVTLQVGGAS